MARRYVKGALARELRYILRDGAADKDFSVAQLCGLLELWNGRAFGGDARPQVLKEIQERKQLLANRFRIREIKKTDGVVDSTSSSSSSSSDSEDDASESEAESKNKQEDTDGSGSVPPPPPKHSNGAKRRKKGAAYESDGEEEPLHDEKLRKGKPVSLTQQKPLEVRKLNLAKQRRARRKFLPLYLDQASAEVRVQEPPIGNLGSIVPLSHAPGLVGIPTSLGRCRSLIVHAEKSCMYATPLIQTVKKRFSRSESIASTRLNHPIFQIAPMHHPSGAWFAARGPKELTLVGLNREGWEWETRGTFELFKLSEFLTQVEPSPYEATRIALLQEKAVLIWDIADSIVPATLCHAPSDDKPFRHCIWGPHPALVYAATNDKLFLHDSRKPSKGLFDALKRSPEIGDRVDCDIIGLAPIFDRKEEVLLATRTSFLTFDVRFPGKPIAHTPHALRMPSKLSSPRIEFVFSKYEQVCFGFTPDEDVSCFTLGAFAPVPSMHPQVHHERLLNGKPLNLDQLRNKAAFRVGAPISRFDEVRSLHGLRLRCMEIAGTEDVMRRFDLYQKASHKGSLYRKKRVTFESILTGGFVKNISKDKHSLVMLGTCFDPTVARSQLDEPHLLYREIPLIPGDITPRI